MPDRQGDHARLQESAPTVEGVCDALRGGHRNLRADMMAKSGHTSVASLARYARPSAEALQHWQERNDPARRR